MAKLDFPNQNFTWYNDDNRVAILSTDSTTTSGEGTTEKYDTYQGDDVAGGLRITTHSRYDYVDAQTDNLKTNVGLDTGLHTSLICYIKARLYEDIGDLQKSVYFRKMFDRMIKQYPSRKSGVRNLAVPRL